MGDDTPEREMKDFQFRQMKKIRVFDSPDVLPTERSSLLAISNKFGLTFAGRDKTLKVFVTDDIIAAGRVSGNTNEIVEGVTCQTVTLDLPMHHLALSSDELTLSVCGTNEETPLTLDFYDVRTFFNKTRQDKRPFASFRAGSEPNMLVQDLKWSPTEAFRLAVCLSDGTMMVVDVAEKVVPVGQLPASVGITCVCWSPKGKQIAAGKQNATVVQYTPVLQEKKVIPCPSFYTADNPVKVLDVLWLSTYNFAVAYAAADGSPETPPELVMVSLPKKDEKKEDKFVNFSDIVFGSCTERQHHYFLNHVEDWDLILAASAASIEVSIIAKQEDKTNWELWMLEDASRGELPVTLNNDDTFPVGLGIDFTNQAEIHISDEKKLPPAPTLLILSTDGVLCPFSLINLNPGIKQLVMAADCLPQSGERAPLQKSAPSISVPAAPKPPPSVFAPFQTSSITPASTSAAQAAPSSTGLSFSLPSSSSSLFSFTPSSSSASIVPSAAGFSFTAPKPPGKDPSFPAFSFGPVLGAQLLTDCTRAPGQVAKATESPIILPKASAEPATPNVRVNLSDSPTWPTDAARFGFSAADTPAPPAPSTQPFSFTSTPKPAAAPDTSAQPKPSVFPISKPPAAPAVTRPAPAQTSAPSAAVQKPAPAAAAPPPTPSTQLSSVKSVEKQLQQVKDLDPVMVGIQEEIAHFKKEMDELKARVRGSDFRVGSSDEMKELRKESEDLHRFTLEMKETTESMHGDISTLKTTLLEGFAGAEEARAQKELSRDKGYLQLLYKKPLDPRSENQLKEIRRLYQYVKFAVEDVNDVLDVEWEKHLEKKRKQRLMIVPEREALYTALANNMHIINQQKQKLEHLVRNLQTLRLYNKTSSQLESSSPSPSPSSSSQGLDSELESLKNALLKACLDTTHKGPSKSPSKMTPVKQSQLRNFLSKRQTPPVRSTAPANLSKSAFLSPKYFEDLDDDVSSTSSLYQSQEYDEPPSVREEPELPQPTLAPPRHPAVVRTTSIQPQAVIRSTALFSEVPPWTAMAISAREAPKINLDSADSTALATKTVTHGPPPAVKTTPLEKATPTALAPAQAAARAALNRQLNSQKPMPGLTELTLKNVPQVVNVQELKDNGAIRPILTDTSSSMSSSPADQTFQQIAATAEAKKNSLHQNSTQTAVKIQLPVTESAPTPPSFVFDQLPKHDAAPPFSLTSPLELQSNKGSSSEFQFSLSTLSSQAQEASASPSVPPSEKILQKPAATALSSKVEPSKSSAVPPFQVPRAQEETLGPFSELRVGPAADLKETPKPSAPFTFKPNGSAGTAASFTFRNAAKPAVAERDWDPPSAAADTPKTAVVFKPPESAASSLSSKTFSFTPASSAPISSFSSLLSASLPQETPSAPEKAPEPEPSPPPPESTSTATREEPPLEPSPEPSALSTSSPSPASITEEPSASQPKLEEPENPSTRTAPVPEATPTPTATPTPLPAETVPVTASKPVQETTPVTTASSAPVEQQQQQPPLAPPPVPAAEPAAPAVPAPPSTTTPGSIFTQPAVSSNSTTLSVTSFTPVISTAGVSTSAPTQTSVFAQPVSTSSTTSMFGSAGFGVPSTTSSFGKPVFAQSSSFGFNPAGGFTFGQLGGSPGFGQTAPVSSAPASVSSSAAVNGGGGGGGGLFGSASSTSASSFSFVPSSTNSGANTGTSIFGQGGGAPAFGQSGSTPGFGQTSLFGSNTATTTSASGFNFGQPSAPFGSTSSTSVFGQQPSNNSVFGQPSSGGSLFGSAAPSSSSSSGGGFFSGLGGKPSEDAANKNPFGTTSTGGFGQANQTGGNLFGNSGAKAFGFGGAAFGDQKASGTFSTGAGSVATQGFGSFSTPAKSGGFGSPPVFGSPPAFGGSPAFGGQATFGSNPAFPNPLGSGAAKVFGEGTSAASVGGFGFASPPSGPSFGSMANQNSTPTFGGLAQQGPGFGSQSAGFSGFGSSGGFGGFGNTNNNQSSSQTFGGWRS
ncbi:nuclear pore complex protein Nup214 isoform X1 [Clarias gariepinus]|uniref:nuclear pore complex protein Nup214 isoform X1 n=1 Tax=Clarias gariepinus TaxID=13013 RepID=UPI00234E15F0|nr:nuclear pore complex protein Nup214 isoform X1 [Clarias gariepinus]